MMLFFLLSLALADPSHDASYEQVRALWYSKREFFASLAQPNPRHFQLLGVDEDACLMAEQQFQTATTTCLTDVGRIFDDNATTKMTPGEVTTAIGAYCDGTCRGQVEAAAQNLFAKCAATQVWQTQCAAATNCSGVPYPCVAKVGGTGCRVDFETLRNIRMILNLFCSKAPGNNGVEKYCVPSFYNFINDNTAPAPTKLDNGCDGCTVLIFSLWSQIEPFQAALHFVNLANVCLRRADTWCILRQAALELRDNQLAQDPKGGQCNTFTIQGDCQAATRGCRWTQDNKCEEDWTGVQGKTKLDLICHPCTLVYVRRAEVTLKLMDAYGVPDNPIANGNRTRAQIIQALDLTQFFAAGICQTDLQDKFCISQVQGQTTFPDISQCSGVATLTKNVGCCAATFVGFAEAMCYVATLLDSNNTCLTQMQLLNTHLVSCAQQNPPVPIGKTCAEQKFVPVVTLVVEGMDLAWFATAVNRALVLGILKKIIAFNGGVDEKDVADPQVNAGATRRLLATGSVVVTAVVGVDSSSSNSALNAGLAPSSNLETLNLNQDAQSQNLGIIKVTSQGVVNTIMSSGAVEVSAFVASVVVAVACLAL